MTEQVPLTRSWKRVKLRIEDYLALDKAGAFEAYGRTELIEGQVVYQNILDAAQAAHADLIVMGSHGRKGLEKLVLGSVAAQVLSHTRLPVMIVREQKDE